MYTFVKIDGYWYLMIKTLMELMAYASIQSREVTKAYLAIKNTTKTGEKVIELDGGHRHMTVLEWALALKLENSPDRKSLIDDVQVLADAYGVGPHMKALERGETVLVNATKLGWQTLLPKHKIQETLTSDICIWPNAKKTFTEADIRTMRWPEGTHWYAKLGDLDVMLDEVLKWDSELEARQAAIEFLKQYQVVQDLDKGGPNEPENS